MMISDIVIDYEREKFRKSVSFYNLGNSSEQYILNF